MELYDLHQIFDYLSGQALWWGLLLLMLSAMIEYIVPPFPGDTITIVGAVLIPTAGWPFLAVFSAVTLGSVIGAAIDWWVGDWLARNKDKNTWAHRLLDRERIRPKVDKVIRQFERHGPIYIAINRFVPAFRAVFFLAAGLARLVLWKVLFFAAISAALWNAAMMGLGYLVGYNIDQLAFWIQRYTRVFYIAIGVALIVWFGIKVVRWIKDKR
jgi:membrane protein DedA with SNARE-associated domain